MWFDHSAMGDLLGEDFSIAAKDTLYRCLDRLLEHKEELFSFLRERWEDLFGAKFDVLLYDLTSTYFESDPPFPEGDKRKFGYSRDKRSDCVQVVIALIVTPEGFPVAYEVLAGNTAEKTTLGGFLQKIEDQYGKAGRIWIMDRGIPTEEVLAEMRACHPPIHYLVGTPKGRLGKLEADLLGLDWQLAREGVEVKLLPRTGELYVLASFPRPPGQGTRHAAPPAQKTLGQASRTPAHGPGPRHIAAQTRRRQKPIPGRLASDRSPGRKRRRSRLLPA